MISGGTEFNEFGADDAQVPHFEVTTDVYNGRTAVRLSVGMDLFQNVAIYYFLFVFVFVCM